MDPFLVQLVCNPHLSFVFMYYCPLYLHNLSNGLFFSLDH